MVFFYISEAEFKFSLRGYDFIARRENSSVFVDVGLLDGNAV
jgi:hypothetical protein